MQRRQFTQIAAASTIALLANTNSLAQMAKPQAGVDYVALEKPVPFEPVAGKVEVIEFFGYWCPHCNAFEPELETWLKRLPANISFKRIPVAFNDAAVPLQKLYYALEAMGRVTDMQRKVFTAIHAEKLNLNTQEGIVAWAVKQGMDQKKFVDIYTSFAVNTKVTRAKQMVNAFKIDGVPSLGIAGRFYTDGTLAKGMTRALQVAEQLANETKNA
ncbi:MAG: thiol:disulfide interchange protein DsbA/DsbL [Burkholderiaceae bacterium]|nr:thiol:disulfide interchange protein DsbA/DsbL [Burkholderiaceae bacterium]